MALGEILVKYGYISKDEVEQLVEYARRVNLPLGQYLITEGKITPEQLGRAVAEQYGLKYLPSSKILEVLDKNKITNFESLARYFEKPKEQFREIVKNFKVIPFFKDKQSVIVAVIPPVKENVKKNLENFFGKEIKFVAIIEQDFAEIVYTRLMTMEVKVAEINITTPIEGKLHEIDPTDLIYFEQNSETIINEVLHSAIFNRATDIHFIATDYGYDIKMRIDGIVVQYKTIPIRLGEEAITRVKVLSDMDIAEKRRPQDGQFVLKVGNQFYNLRVATTGTSKGKENMFIRLLYKRTLFTNLSSLGMLEPQEKLLRELISKPYGIILVAGPTGAGKTTTLYAILKELYNKGERNIITIEDPVEYDFDGITQIQVNPKADITFSSVLRSVLRQDPDIILVGEIRDKETMRTAIESALSGHLVLSTIHANNAISTVSRLISMESEPILLASAINGIIAQRLLRKYDFASGTYKGRIGVFEVLDLNIDLRKMIAMQADVTDFYKAARRFGMLTMQEVALSYIEEQITTEEEVTRVFGVLKPNRPSSEGAILM